MSDAVEQAASGHPGMPMGAASMAYVLWTSSPSPRAGASANAPVSGYWAKVQ